MYPQYATGYEEIVGRRPVDPRDIVSGVSMVPYGYGGYGGQALPPPPPPAPPPHMVPLPANAAPPHPMAGPHTQPCIWRTRTTRCSDGAVAREAQPVIFARLPRRRRGVRRSPRSGREAPEGHPRVPAGFFQCGHRRLHGSDRRDLAARRSSFRGERLVIPSGLDRQRSLAHRRQGRQQEPARQQHGGSRVRRSRRRRSACSLALDTATVAMDIALVVENITADNQTFQAALIGTAAQ